MEGLERRHQLAGGVEIDSEPPAAHRLDALDEALGIHADAGRALRPGHHHGPLDALLRDGRRGEAAGGGSGDTRALHELGTFHGRFPPGEAACGLGRRLAVPAGESYAASRSEEHTSELQSLMRISYAVFCL